MLTKIARFSFRRRWIVIFIWLILLVGAVLWSKQVGNTYATNFSLPSSDSQQALDLLQQKFPAQSGASGDLVIKADEGISSQAVQETINSVITQIKAVPHVTSVNLPSAAAGQISADGKIAKAAILFDEDGQTVSADTATISAIRNIAGGKTINGVQFELGSQLFADQISTSKSEGIGLIAAVVILLIAFGSVLAMGVPIVTAITSIGIGVSVVTLLSHVLSIPNFTTEVASMIGIGVGIDYALFIVTRYRQGLQDGLGEEQAIVVAINTAGRSVIFAGITVVISLLGMVLINLSFIQGLGIGSAAVVLIVMLASITLLPAILAIIGKWIDKLRLPFGRSKAAGEEEGVWYRWGQFIQQHAWLVLLGGLAILVFLAIPVFSIQLGSSDARSLPTTDTTRRAYDLESQGFGPGSNGPLLLAASIGGPSDLATLETLRQKVALDTNVAFVSPAVPNGDMTSAIMQLIPKTSPQDTATVDLIHRLRDTTLPQALSGTDIHVNVGGVTATFDDIAQTLTARLPVFIGTVLILSFLLLMVVFRSVLIPLKAVILNTLSISAAYGILVAVFQWGWLSKYIGVGATGPIESFVPMMLFAILFGLSMDYEVFLLSRIKEEYDLGEDNRHAVSHGLSSTARIITAAAAIMVMVFGSFVLGDQRVIKEFGIGLASAIFIDASIARLLLVPAAMELLGKKNWWLPRFLHWLPIVHIDGNDVAGVGQKTAN